MFYVSGQPGDPLNSISFAFADVVGASILPYGIVSIVAALERYGIGQRVDASHLQAFSWLQIWGVGICYYKNLLDFPRVGRKTAPNLISDRVQRIGDLASDPARLANGYLLDIDHPRNSPLKQVAPQSASRRHPQGCNN